ncbi:MAG: WhiB family transcriptional regulator [Streptosporangiaceae bacterium]
MRLAHFPKELSCRHQSSPSAPLAGCRRMPAGVKIASFSSPSPRRARRWRRSSPPRSSASRCAVRAACLSYALVTGQAGIWGGTTQEERHAMRRSSGLPAREHSASPGSPNAAARHRGNPGGQ